MIRFAALAVVAALAACTSPESTRTRGGGPGADTGNRGGSVKMHEGSRPFQDTPRLTVGESVSLEGASQARDLSRPWVR